MLKWRVGVVVHPVPQLEFDFNGDLVRGRDRVVGAAYWIALQGLLGYPDCRLTFFDAFQQVIDVGTKPETDIELQEPFVEWSKTEIAESGLELRVPYEMTWSYYWDEEPACETCDACAFRLEAFRNAGSRDPIGYAERPEFS